MTAQVISHQWVSSHADNEAQQQSSASVTSTRVVIKAVLFDLDGTLLDTEALSDRASLQAFQHFGVPVPQDLLVDFRLPWSIKKQILGLPGHQWIPLVLQFAQDHWIATESDDGDHSGKTRQLKLPSVDDFWKCWESNLNSFCEQVEACRGAAEMVERLAGQNIPLAIATSSRSVAVVKKRIRHEESIFRHISAIVTGDDPAVVHGKPAPDIYLEAARRLGVSPSECLVVEDASAGVASALAAGCAVVVAVPDARFTSTEKMDLFRQPTNEHGSVVVVLDALDQFDGRPFGIPVNMNK